MRLLTVEIKSVSAPFFATTACWAIKISAVNWTFHKQINIVFDVFQFQLFATEYFPTLPHWQQQSALVK